MADFKQGTAEEVKSGAAQYEAGAIVGDQARTYVGRKTTTVTTGRNAGSTYVTNPGTSIYHRTVVYPKQDSSGKVIGADRVVYVEKNGTWQPAAISKDGGKTYQFSDANYPTMSGVAGAGLQNELNSKPPKGIRLNVDAQVNKSLTTSGVPTTQKKAVVDSIKNNADQNPTPDGQSGEGGGGGESEQTAVIPEITADNQRLDFAPELKYPTDLSRTYQDFFKIQMVEFKARGVSSGVLPSRPNDLKDRTILSTIFLPIPGGIGDNNNVSWSKNDKDIVDQNLANLADQSIRGGGAGARDAASGTANAIQNNPGAVQNMVANRIVEGLTGVNVLQRKGALINKNTELLFDGVTLRTFTFNIKFAPRSGPESKVVQKIIRTLKQGMSPKKANGFAFIKAPHTFFLSYENNNGPQPFLNKFKECALTGMAVNYTPDGNYATYYDGSMVSYTVTLTFQELEPVFDSDYGNDYDNIGY